MRTQNPYTVLAICGSLLLAVGLVFGQTVGHDFVNFDDDQYVYENARVAAGMTAEGVTWSFTQSHAHNWHPLTWLSHMLDCQLYGLKPWGHHLTNVLLHAAAAIALFLVLWRMTSDLWPSALVAAVFAVHPLHVESVAWVAERKDVLSGLFLMLTLGAYVGYARHPFSVARYLAVMVLFAMGLAAKPMLVTLPVVLLLLDYWPLGRFGQSIQEKSANGSRMPMGRASSPRYLVTEKLPMLALALASCVVTLRAQHGALMPNECISLPWRIANALVSSVAYLGQFFCPVGLAVFYPHPAESLPIWKVAGSLLLLAGISAGVVALRRRCPYLLVGWLWYLVTLVPVIGVVQVGEQAMADRYAYLTQIGLYIALAWGVAQATRRWWHGRRVCAVAAAIVLAGMMGLAWRQASYWHDSETLWDHALACTARNHVAHLNLGTHFAEHGRTDEAIAQYRQALEINPDFAAALCNLGAALSQQGQDDEATAHIERALAIKPDYAEAHFDLGELYRRQGRLDEAIAHGKRAVQLRPDFAAAYCNLGAALSQQGRIDEAIDQYRSALAIKPDDAEAHCYLGELYRRQGRLDEAIEHGLWAVRIEPGLAEAHCNLGAALGQQGRFDEAIDHLQKALAIKPQFPMAQKNLDAAVRLRGENAVPSGKAK